MASRGYTDHERAGLLNEKPSYENYNQWGYHKSGGGGKHSQNRICLCALIVIIFSCVLILSNLMVYYSAGGFNRAEQLIIDDKVSTKSVGTPSASPLSSADGAAPDMKLVAKQGNNTTASTTTAHHPQDNCVDTDQIKTFPNIEYSFYGYDILKGNPVSDGIDPGFTRPIFAADFSSQQKTADCRFAIPDGLSAAPDEACSTHFTSRTLNTSEEYDHSLSRKAHASAGIFGFKFSASYSYQSTKQIIKKGFYKLIHSTAECSYYSTSLKTYDLPPFSKEMQRWLKRMNDTFSTSDETQDNVLFEFLDYFGTHIPAKVVYGATHTFENKLTSSSYRNLSSQSTSVDAQASFAGLFSIGGGVSWSESTKQMVSRFQSLTETTTKTLGSPPPKGGDATSWVQSVQSSPAPIQYDLILVSQLFTDDLMKSFMSEQTVQKIQRNFEQVELEYCRHLSSTKYPYVVCEAKLEQKYLNSTRVVLKSFTANSAGGVVASYPGVTIEQCSQKCTEIAGCVTIVMSGSTCTLLRESTQSDNSSLVIKPADGYTTIILQEHLVHNTRLFGYRFDQTAVRGDKYKISHEQDDFELISDRCGDFCSVTDSCQGFEVSNNTIDSFNCVLYEKLGVTFWTHVPQYDFETTLLALAPQIQSIPNRQVEVDLTMVSTLGGQFKGQSGCGSSDCCNMTCLYNSLCLASAFNTDKKMCYHLALVNSEFYANQTSPTAPYGVIVYPERVVDTMFRITGYSFPDARFAQVYSVYSSDECARKCAVNARCTVASWAGKTSGTCVLHDDITLRLSKQVADRDAVLLFPSLNDRIKASKYQSQNTH